MSHKILVVIPTLYGKSGLYYAIADCLRDPAGVEVLVVDNSPGSQCFHVANVKNKRFHHRISVSRPGRNLNWLRANNLGATVALVKGFDYVCFLNDDVRLSRDFFQQLLRAFTERERTFLAVPRYNGRFGTAQAKPHPGQDFTETTFTDGTCMLISRESLEKVGSLDTCFRDPGWGADVDYCHRISQAGGRIFVVNTTFLTHYREVGGQSARIHYGSIQGWVTKGMRQAKEDLARKYGPHWRDILPLPVNAYNG